MLHYTSGREGSSTTARACVPAARASILAQPPKDSSSLWVATLVSSFGSIQVISHTSTPLTPIYTACSIKHHLHTLIVRHLKKASVKSFRDVECSETSMVGWSAILKVLTYTEGTNKVVTNRKACLWRGRKLGLSSYWRFECCRTL